jgi:hypothetical protein
MVIPTMAAAHNAFHNDFTVDLLVSVPTLVGDPLFCLGRRHHVAEGSPLAAGTQFLPTDNRVDAKPREWLRRQLRRYRLLLIFPETLGCLPGRKVGGHHPCQRTLDGPKTILAAGGEQTFLDFTERGHVISAQTKPT